jgi:gamma-glutamylcyclotransferase (GGCT)/AIG2-like uncharacterized protein YtfP
MRGYPRHRLLVGEATFLGEGRVRGILLDLPGGYPGLVDDDDAAEANTTARAHAPHPQHATLGRSRPRRTRYSIRGELYRLRDAELLRTLDREEGYNFERLRAGVVLTDGRRSRAWVYRYRGSRERAVPIPHGDYRRAYPRPEPYESRATSRRIR